MKNFIQTVFIVILFCLTSKVFGQNEIISDPIDTMKMYKIDLNDGTVFIGNILQKDSIQLIIKTASIPRIEIPLTKLKSIVELNKSNYKNGTYWFQNPNATRYFYGPSAFNLKKGEGYYQNTYLFLNSVSYGITDNITIGAGFEILSLIFNSFDRPIFFITPKVGFEVTDKFNAGGGILFATAPYGNLGISYVVGTYGTSDHNLTGGLGWGFINGDFSKKPTITLSGVTRLSRKLALVTENWLIPGNRYTGIYSFGIRFFGEKISVDLAFINSSEISEFSLIGIPYVDFVVKF